jgi:hypothetical protein
MSINERRPQLHTYSSVHRQAATWFSAILGALVVSLMFAAVSHAEEGLGNPNDYRCNGGISAGAPEVGSSEPQVQYTFSCSGPITGYQLESQLPVTGFAAGPLVSNPNGEPLSDSFSCGGEVPGFAFNCVGATRLEFETVTGEFAIGTKVCAEPRVDPLLTVTYAFLEKGVVTQAISGPFDLGRPLHCPFAGYRGGTRLSPTTPAHKAKANKHKRGKGTTSTRPGKTKKK